MKCKTNGFCRYKGKIVGIMLLVAFLLFVLDGCGPKESTPTKTETTEKQEETGTENGAAGAAELKIVIVTSPSGVDDGSFNEDNYNGIKAFIEKNPNSSVKDVKETTGEAAASVQAVEDVVADYDVVVTPGFQFAGISQIAEDNPDKKFILVDSDPAPIDEKTVFENIYAMSFAEQESGFFAGVAAAFETKTGKVAVVNGMAFPSNVNYQYGFEAGVQYANKHMETKAEIVEIESYAGTDVTGVVVGGNYINSFSDESQGKVVGNALIDEGCDILFVAAGNAGNGVFTAAKETEDVRVIGCDVDQYSQGESGGRNIVLTSALKNMAINVERQLDAIAAGSFEGKNELLKADTDSTGYVFAEGRHQLSESTLEKLKEVYDKVKAGEITPPSNFSGTTPEDFPGL